VSRSTAANDSATLLRTLRRMALVSPEALEELVRRCAEGISSAAADCVRERGAFAAVALLTRHHPAGRGSAARTPPAVMTGEERVRLLSELDQQLPPRTCPQATSICDARLDDVVVREILDHTHKSNAGTKGEEILERLFAAYEVAPALARLDKLTTQLEGRFDLSGTVLVAHQHILGSVASQFEAMWRLGLAPKRTFVIGKPYSTSRLTATYLERRGCQVQSSLSFDREDILAPDWYQSAREDALRRFFGQVVRDLRNSDVTKLIVLDDGGLVLQWLNKTYDGELLPEAEMSGLAALRVVGVEQTTFGSHLLARLDKSRRRAARYEVPVPVANVAQAYLKLKLESPLIAESVVRELTEWIRSSDAKGSHTLSLARASVGVIGYGSVGAAVCKRLEDEIGRRAVVYDEEASRASVAMTHGFRVVQSPAELARECSVIIGCTGARDGVALEADELSPGTILASASSGNYEFTRAFLTRHRPSRPPVINPEITPQRPASAFDWVHSIFPVKRSGGEVFVLNGGFPVNFTGAVDPIKPDQIELTRCLMLTGVAAALRQLGSDANFGGTVELAPMDQRLLWEMFML
jgi:NAD binding domain of 6-phosphogluconate dehydrogenase